MGPGQSTRPFRDVPPTGGFWIERLLLAAAFLIPLTIFIATMAPTIYNLDSAELTTAAYTGGLTRATGYPLYLLIGRFWSRLPVGDVGYRMNLFSAVCGALTIALAARILRRIGVGWWAILAGLGLLVATRFFWGMSLIAEVYTLHTALMCGAILLVLRWADQPTPNNLALAVLLTAVSFGNHAATSLLVPGLVWFVLGTAPRQALQRASLLRCSAALVAGLAIYLYLPLLYLAHPVVNYAGTYTASGRFVPVDLTTPSSLWWLVSGRAFADRMLAYASGDLLAEIGHFGTELWRTSVAVAMGPALVGLVAVFYRRPPLGGMLLLMFLFNVGFYADYQTVDKETMFLPAYLVWALWIAAGYQVLLEWATASGDPSGASARWALRSIMVGSVIFALLWSAPLVDLSNDWSARREAEAVLSRLEPGALLVGSWATVPVIEYLRFVEGRRTDVDTINIWLIKASDLRRLLLRELDRRPVYVDEISLAELPGVVLEQEGTVYRLERRPGS